MLSFSFDGKIFSTLSFIQTEGVRQRKHRARVKLVDNSLQKLNILPNFPSFQTQSSHLKTSNFYHQFPSISLPLNLTTMPQVDLEALVSVCGGSTDRKITCETLADDDLAPEEEDLPEIPSDFPPESFWLSKDAEYDWFERNAVYERKKSTKGNSNVNQNPNSNSSSQRFSKAAIIGLPKTQKSCFVNAKFRRNSPAKNIRFFPKRSASTLKSAVPMTEPSSPKVSCMGRVRSKRDRSRRLRNSRRSAEAELAKSKSTSRRKPGLWTSFRSMFRSRCRHQKVVGTDQRQREAESPPRSSVTARVSNVSANEPPGLGGMMRFTSGRRSESWGVGEIDGDNLYVSETKSEPLGRDALRRGQ